MTSISFLHANSSISSTAHSQLARYKLTLRWFDFDAVKKAQRVKFSSCPSPFFIQYFLLSCSVVAPLGAPIYFQIKYLWIGLFVVVFLLISTLSCYPELTITTSILYADRIFRSAFHNLELTQEKEYLWFIEIVWTSLGPTRIASYDCLSSTLEVTNACQLCFFQRTTRGVTLKCVTILNVISKACIFCS